MISWLSAYYGDILVLMVLGLIVGAVIASMVRGRKAGKHCGCSSCKGCAMADSCHCQHSQ